VSHRRVENIEWAKPVARPACIPRSRPRGTKGQGLAYERKFARALTKHQPSVEIGPWYEYLADGKFGYCQPDFVLWYNLELVVFEVKLTNVEQATEQLLDLYFPILRAVYRVPVRGIIVTKSVHRCPQLATICSSLGTALKLSTSRVPVLHWIGLGPI
jgi:hypothetical protein